MLLKHIALVSQSKSLAPSELSQTAAALQKQITRDLGPIWDIHATIDYFPDLRSVPLGYWPIIIAENIKQPGAAGFHTDRHNQPFSLVELDESWQLTCSHEMCEMLVDPYGNRLIAAGSPMAGQGKVNFLVEVCDPCEDASFAYSINGILVSDFYTPNYFDPQQEAVPGVRYSFNGSILKPLEIKTNGYLSWQDPISKKWYQANHFGNELAFNELKGMKEFGKSLRSQIDKLTKNPNSEKSYKEAAKKHLTAQLGVFNSGISMSQNTTIEVSALLAKKTEHENHLTAAAMSAGAPLTLTATFYSTDYGHVDATVHSNGNSTTQSINLVNGNQDTPRIIFANVGMHDVLTLKGNVAAGSVRITIDRVCTPPLIGNYTTSFNDITVITA